MPPELQNSTRETAETDYEYTDQSLPEVSGGSFVDHTILFTLYVHNVMQ